MDTHKILEQILKSGQQMLDRGQEITEDKLNIPEQGPERDAMLSGIGKGALITGGLAALLGTRAGRRLTGGTLKLGGLAAIGGLAYQTYQKWQQENPEQANSLSGNRTQFEKTKALDRSQLLVKAMIAAAKADGVIDETERANINQQISELGLDQDSAFFIEGEMKKILNAGDIAAEVDTPETAAEIYSVTRTIIDLDNEKERSYLDELTIALNLPAELITELDKKINET